MANPGTDVAAAIAAGVPSLTLGANVFVGPVRPEGQGIPGEAVFCLLSGGPAPGPFVKGGAGPEQRFPVVSVRVRSAPRDFQGGESLARAVFAVLHHTPLAGYVGVDLRNTDPIYLGDTEKGHHEWSLDVALQHLE